MLVVQLPVDQDLLLDFSFGASLLLEQLLQRSVERQHHEDDGDAQAEVVTLHNLDTVINL